MSIKHEKPTTFDPAKIRVNGQVQSVLAQKAEVPNDAVRMYKRKEGQLTEADYEEVMAKKAKKEENT